jgi:cell division protein ZapA (FtsZ GTPase activity inhibitor)
MHELDGVLHRQDMTVFRFIFMVDHGGQRRGFAGTGRAGDQHHAAWIVRDLFEDLGGLELFERQDRGGNGPEDGKRPAVLVGGIDPKARQIRHGKGKVALEEFLVVLALLVVHDVIHHVVDFLVVQRWHVDAADIAVDPDHRRQAGRQMQIRCAVLDAESQ